MKKRILTTLTLVMAIVISMTISTSAFEGVYFDTTECWDYTEEETVIGESVEAIVGTETYPDKNTKGVNSYNVYAVEMDIEGLDADAIFDQYSTDMSNKFYEIIETQSKEQGFSSEIVSFDKSVAWDSWELFSFIYFETEILMTDKTGKSITMYQNIAVLPANTYVVYVTVTNYNSAEECKEVLYEIIDYIEIHDYCYDESADFSEEDIEMFTKIGTGVLIGVLVFFLLAIVITVVIIVVVVKASKKKKAQKMAQQPQYNFDPRTGQPIQNNQPWQNTSYQTYTPPRPTNTEIKDPLDLDNK